MLVFCKNWLKRHIYIPLIEKHGLNFNKFLKEKIEHLEHLKTRKEMGHEHPKHEPIH